MPGRTGHRPRKSSRIDRASWLAELTACVRAGEYAIDPERIARAILLQMPELAAHAGSRGRGSDR